jgi:hypothetical protein
MKSVELIVRNYMQKAGRLEPIKLGPEATPRKPVKEDISLVETALKNQLKICNRVITIAIILLFTLVLLFVGIGIMTAFQGKGIVVIGGSFISLVVIIKKLLDTALEKSTIATTLAIINNQPPEVQEKALEALYWNLLNRNHKE